LSAIFGDVRTSVETLFDAAHDGSLDALIVIGSDPLGDGLFSMQARRAMGKVPLIQVGAVAGDISEFADVMLPAAAYSEVEGTFVNMEGEVRLAEHPLKTLGDERPLWKVMMRLIQGFDVEVPVVNLSELRSYIQEKLPFLTSVWDAGLKDEGYMPVVRNRNAKALPSGVAPAMPLDVISRYSMYREGAWVRASKSLAEAGLIRALDDLLVHPNTLKEIGVNAGVCTIRTASGDYTFDVGVRDDVVEGALFVAKRGVAGDMSCEVMASLGGGQ